MIFSVVHPITKSLMWMASIDSTRHPITHTIVVNNVDHCQVQYIILLSKKISSLRIYDGYQYTNKNLVNDGHINVAAYIFLLKHVMFRSAQIIIA